MPFFDFHIHPTLKSLFSDRPQKLSPWEKLDTRMIPDMLRWCTEFKYILQSQANLNQLWYNECRLICVALYAPEENLLNNDLIYGQADGKMKVYLNKAKLNKMIKGTIAPYDLLVKDDLQTLLNPQDFDITDKKIVPLFKSQDYDETKADTIYVVFSVEGCHSLASTMLSKISKDDVIRNLDDLTSKIPVLAINLVHMERSSLCNHAYGMQFLKHEQFKPVGMGLSSDGAKIAEHCYRKNIMIDVKHMSLMARLQLYNLRNSPSFAGINQPLICTHAGFTGISMKRIPEFVYKMNNYPSKGYGVMYLGKPWLSCRGTRPSFNTSSINLFDEDIEAILKSGGMIGLSLDKRILGFADPEGHQLANQDTYPLEVEFFSMKERQYFQDKEKFSIAFEKGNCIENLEVSEAGPVNPRLGDYHLRHFMAHIIHLIKVAEKAGININQCLKQVCIGSDFDGIINPVWICDTTDELVYFKERFEKCFVLFSKDCKVALPNGFNIREFTEDLFYRNGKDFVMRRLDNVNV
jgi:microsomal dipeptidase-like Zn-dependent dipeptidase